MKALHHTCDYVYVSWSFLESAVMWTFLICRQIEEGGLGSTEYCNKSQGSQPRMLL